MTATEQLAIWAAAPNDDVFIWLQYPQADESWVHLGGADKPHVVGRMRAADVIAGFEKNVGAKNAIARDVLARFVKRADVVNNFRVDEIKGIAFVIVEGRSPVAPYSAYRLLLSSVEPFI